MFHRPSFLEQTSLTFPSLREALTPYITYERVGHLFSSIAAAQSTADHTSCEQQRMSVPAHNMPTWCTIEETRTALPNRAGDCAAFDDRLRHTPLAPVCGACHHVVCHSGFG